MDKAAAPHTRRGEPGFDLVRLNHIHRSTPHAIFFSAIAAAVAAITLAGTIPPALLAVWLGGNCLTIAGLVLDWRRTRASTVAVLRAWEKRLTLGLLLQGLLWFALFYADVSISAAQRDAIQMLAYVTLFTTTAVYCLSLPAFLALAPLVLAGELIWVVAGKASVTGALLVVLLHVSVQVVGWSSFRRVLLAGVGASLARRDLLAEHEALFNNSLVGMAHVRDGRFVRVNPAFARICGLPVEDIHGSSIWRLYRDEAVWQHSIAAASGTGGQVSHEHEYTRPDQQRLTLRVHTGLIGTGNGIGKAGSIADSAGARPRDYLYTIMDITAERHAEQQLAAREQAYRQLAETYRIITSAAPALIWATDTTGVYSFVGERGSLDILGVPAAQAVGKRNTSLITLPAQERDEAAFKRLLAGEPLHNYVNEMVQPGGRRLYISTSGGVVRDAGGKVTGACGISIDVTERQRDAVALQNAQALLISAINSLPDAFALFDADDRLVLANTRYVQLFTSAADYGDIAGMRFADLVRSSIARGEPVPSEYGSDTEAWVAERVRRHQIADGQPMSYRIGGGRTIRATETRTPDGGIVGVRTDVTELERTRALLTGAIDNMSDGFALFGADDRLLLCNRRYAAMIDPANTPQQMTGMTVEQIIRFRLVHGERIAPEFLGDTEAWVKERLRRHRSADDAPQIHELEGGRWLQMTKRRTPDGGIVDVYSDITVVKRAEEAVRRLSQHDTLTGLPNRRLLEDRLALALARAQRESAIAGLLLIDLDGFKPVNDQFGHRTGDEVLRVVAQRLRDCVRAVDTVARQGGDEFVIVLDGLAHSSDAGAVADKVIASLARPIEPVWMTSRNTPDLRIGCSIGISLYPQDGAAADQLMHRADAAMYRAKAAGRGRLVYYSLPGDRTG